MKNQSKACLSHLHDCILKLTSTIDNRGGGIGKVHTDMVMSRWMLVMARPLCIAHYGTRGLYANTWQQLGYKANQNQTRSSWARKPSIRKRFEQCLCADLYLVQGIFVGFSDHERNASNALGRHSPVYFSKCVWNVRVFFGGSLLICELLTARLSLFGFVVLNHRVGRLYG